MSTRSELSAADRAKAEALLAALDEKLFAAQNPAMALAVVTRLLFRILEGAVANDPDFVREWLAHFNANFHKRLGLQRLQ